MNMPTRKFENDILNTAGKYLDLKKYRVFIFGSRIKGNNFSRSDIDVGIQGDRALPVELKMDLAQALENLPTLYKIDLVDFADVSAEFKKNALKHAQEIGGQNESNI